MFALIDVNNFYTSCEKIFRPDLANMPVVVVSNNDGCVISRSKEAKKLGIKMGEPYFKIKDLLYQHRVTVFSSNYALYADMSERVMNILEEMGPGLDIYSIDEAFMDISGLDKLVALEDFGRMIQKRLIKETGLTVGVGIAPTKTLAKMANYAAKKWPQTGGVVDLSNPERQQKLLALVSVKEVWGIGHRLSKKLNGMGIKSAADLAHCSIWVLRKHFSVVLERTARELRGECCLAKEELMPIKQQIMCSRSFGVRITNYTDMRQAICAYAERAAQKLREKHQYCRLITIFIRTSPHVAGEAFYSRQSSTYLMMPSHDTRDIVACAVEVLDRIWTEGHRYIKAGVILSDFYSQGVAQLNLFDDRRPRTNSDQLMTVIDKLNRSGRNWIWFAGQGTEQGWKMRREMLSPAYTTRYADLPRAR